MKIETVKLDNGNLVVNKCYLDLLELNGINTAKELFDIQSVTDKAVVKERGTSRAILNGTIGTRVLTGSVIYIILTIGNIIDIVDSY